MIDYIISEDMSFIQLLIDIGNLAAFLNMCELRDGILDILFSVPVNSTYQKMLQKTFLSALDSIKIRKLLKNDPSKSLDLSVNSRQKLDDFEIGGVTQQLYFLQVSSVFLNFH